MNSIPPHLRPDTIKQNQINGVYEQPVSTSPHHKDISTNPELKDCLEKESSQNLDRFQVIDNTELRKILGGKIKQLSSIIRQVNELNPQKFNTKTSLLLAKILNEKSKT